MFDSAKKQINAISRIASFIGTTVLLLMMVLVVIDVSLRYVLNRPIPGIPELIEFAMICVGFLGIAWCAVRKGHVSVDLVVNHFSKKVQAGFDILAHLIGLVVFSLLSWQGFLQADQMRRIANASRTLHVPTYPFYFVLAIGCSVLCLVLLVDLIQSFKKVIEK
ncbi:TRAP transporter small permease [Thermodesulfobacteriota bacterium]